MTKTEATKFVIALAQAGNQRAAAAVMGVAQSLVSARLGKARAVLGVNEVEKLMTAHRPAGLPPVVRPVTPRAINELADALVAGEKAVVDRHVLEDQLKTANNKIKQLVASALDNEKVRRTIFEIAHTKPTIPEWLSAPKGATAKRPNPSVPILFGSDWHWGEVVRPSEIEGINEYNVSIARARLNRLIEGTITMLTENMAGAKYPGIVFALGGDLVSGNIHEELVETNEMRIMPAVLDLVSHLAAAIKRLKSVFGKVFLPCVTGNHGRGQKKTSSKESNFSSFDWLIYQTLDMLFAEDPDVVFFIPDGSDALVSVYGHRYLFSHGDQFPASDSLIGPLGAVARGDHKKRGRNQQVGLEYDTLVIGHFHQLMLMQRFIMNGSLIGYTEGAYKANLSFERPQQALWLNHPEHGITFSMPVHVGETAVKATTAQPWVQFHEAKAA